MHHTFTFILTLAVFFNSSVALAENAAEEDTFEYTKEELKDKVITFERMQRGGIIMLIGGVTLDAVGTGVLISGIIARCNDKGYDWWYLDPPDGLGRILLGSFGLVVGILVTVGGCAVKNVGKEKTGIYKNQLEKLSFTIAPNGFSLRYYF